MKRRLDLLTSPAFLAALTLLLLNDAVLKPAFGNALTGKLSDLAGLFAFATFWTALWPRAASAIHIATALLFAIWKSPLVTPALTAWSASVPVWHLERVIDPTDLLVLPVLLVSFWHVRREPEPRPILARLTLPVAFVSLFAFAATSRPVIYKVPDRYLFAGSSEKFVGQLRALGIEYQVIRDDCGRYQLCGPISELRVTVGRQEILFEVERFERRRGLIVRLRKIQLFHSIAADRSRDQARGIFAETIARPLGMQVCLDRRCRRVAPID